MLAAVWDVGQGRIHFQQPLTRLFKMLSFCCTAASLRGCTPEKSYPPTAAKVPELPYNSLLGCQQPLIEAPDSELFCNIMIIIRILRPKARKFAVFSVVSVRFDDLRPL